MAYRNDLFRSMAAEIAADRARHAPSYFEHNAQQASRRPKRRALRLMLGRGMRQDPYNTAEQL